MTARLGYDVHGPQGAPVVVLGSSLGTTREMWEDVLPAISQRYRVIRFDHRGHGESEVPPGPYAITDLASDVMALLDRLDVGHAHLGGLSLGGAVAMQVAVDAPERVDSLAVVCSAAQFSPASGWLDRAAAVRAGGMAAIADAVAARWFTDAFQASPRATELREALLMTSPEGYAGCCEALAATDLRPALSGVVAPTLVVAAAEDPATPVERSVEIVDALGTAEGRPVRLEVVDGAAHLAGVEKPEQVGKLMLEHFDLRQTS